MPGGLDASGMRITPRQLKAAIPFAWFVWQKGYTGQTTIKWILTSR
jgi:hypothetical protein